MRRIENWLKYSAQRLIICWSTWSPAGCSGVPVSSSVLQELVLGPGLFSFFISDLENETECTLTIFSDHTKLGEWVIGPMGVLSHRGTSAGWRTAPTEMSRKTTKWTAQSCTLGRNSPMHQYTPWVNWLQSNLAKKYVEVLVGKWKMNSKSPLKEEGLGRKVEKEEVAQANCEVSILGNI